MSNEELDNNQLTSMYSFLQGNGVRFRSNFLYTTKLNQLTISNHYSTVPAMFCTTHLAHSFGIPYKLVVF